VSELQNIEQEIDALSLKENDTLPLERLRHEFQDCEREVSADFYKRCKTKHDDL